MIEVSATGEGIAAENLASIFAPFFTTRASGRGTGLGLSMVYGFVRQSNGHLDVDSEVGRDTAIRLYLPRHDRPGDAVGTAAPAAASKTVNDETVPVVEDNDDVRQTTAMQLRSLGYRVIEAGSGDAAWKILSKDRVEVDLLFTDIAMPDTLDGCQLARQALEGLPRIAILLTSGFPRDIGIYCSVTMCGSSICVCSTSRIARTSRRTRFVRRSIRAALARRPARDVRKQWVKEIR